MINSIILVCTSGATAITFDDIPNPPASETGLPTNYAGLSWTNGRYLNTAAFANTGYTYACASGAYVTWFNSVITIQTLVSTNTVTLNSFVMVAGWSNGAILTVDGCYSSTQIQLH